MTWLVVLGSGPGFAYADHTRTMRNWSPGVHLDVDEECIAFARKANMPSVILGEGDPPQIIRQPTPDVPFRPEHFRLPPAGTILLAAPIVQEQIAEADPDRPLDFACTHCGARFPHSAPLRRHVERSHDSIVQVEPEREPELVPEPDANPPLTDA